jgi:hypothetical protein
MEKRMIWAVLMSFQVKHLSDRCCKSLSFQVNLFVAPDEILRNVYLLW